MTKRANTGAILGLVLGVGCGASEVRVPEPSAAPASAVPDAAATEEAEAKRIIEAQFQAHAEAMGRCLVDYLVKNGFDAVVDADFAIGQEGRCGVRASARVKRVRAGGLAGPPHRRAS